MPTKNALKITTTSKKGLMATGGIYACILLSAHVFWDFWRAASLMKSSLPRLADAAGMTTVLIQIAASEAVNCVQCNSH